MTIVIALLAAGAASFALRFVPARALAGRRLPRSWDRGLTFAGPAVFTALAAPAVVTADGSTVPVIARIAAVVVAIAVARSTRSTVATLAAGLPTLWLATALAGS
jgi:branched-subunit amino acid transport protein